MPKFDNPLSGIKEITNGEDFKLRIENDDGKKVAIFNWIEREKQFPQNSDVSIVFNSRIIPTENKQQFNRMFYKHAYELGKVNALSEEKTLTLDYINSADNLSAVQIVVLDETKKYIGASKKENYSGDSEEGKKESESLLWMVSSTMDNDYTIDYEDISGVTLYVNKKIADISNTTAFQLNVLRTIYTHLLITDTINEPEYKNLMNFYTRYGGQISLTDYESVVKVVETFLGELSKQNNLIRTIQDELNLTERK